jgi:uncharacterized protein YdhG (YjbR/CyaY superfamily)
MTAHEIDAYLASVEGPPGAALDDLRATLRALLPDAEEGLAYRVPAFKVGGKAVAGFAAYKDHLSYLPHSGSVLSTLADELHGWETSKGALKFTADRPLPTELVTSLVAARLRELEAG